MIKIKGKLYICPTPLGNLEDISLRVLRVLREVDLVAAEDTRRTRKLLTHYDIHTPTISFHQHSSNSQLEGLLSLLEEGKTIALVSDAGTPGISDPGQPLVAACFHRDIEVDPLPGPCAAIVAASACGFPLAAFTFYGFLPRKGLDKAVAAISHIRHPVILYESPRRIVKLMEAINAHMHDREIVLARELTKVHQQIIRGTPMVLIDKVYSDNLERGEYTVVLGPWSPVSPQLSEADIIRLAEDYIGQGLSTRDSIDRVSLETGYPRRNIYNLVNKKKQDT